LLEQPFFIFCYYCWSPTKASPSSSGSSKPTQSNSQTSAGKAAAARSKKYDDANKRKKVTGTAWKTRDSAAGSSQNDAPPPPPTYLESELRLIKFVSPFVENELVIGSEFDEHLEDCLNELLPKDPLKYSCLMIKNLTSNKDSIEGACTILNRLLTNIISDPTEKKFLKIRPSNGKIKRECLSVLGTEQFLFAVGFQIKDMENAKNEVEPFFVMEEHDIDVTKLQTALETLADTKPLERILHRNRTVTSSQHIPQESASGHSSGSSGSRDDNNSDKFYKMSGAELRNQQLQRSHELEQSQMMRTKAMREADKKNSGSKHNYSFIKIRFPDGKTLLG